MDHFEASCTGIARLKAKEVIRYKANENTPSLLIILDIPNRAGSHFIEAYIEGEEAERISLLSEDQEHWFFIQGNLVDNKKGFMKELTPNISIQVFSIKEISKALEGIIETTIIGRLTRAPDKASTSRSANNEFTRCSVAVNQQSENKKNVARFFDCSCFNTRTQTKLVEEFKKGDQIYLSGHLAFFKRGDDTHASVNIQNVLKLNV